MTGTLTLREGEAFRRQETAAAQAQISVAAEAAPALQAESSHLYLYTILTIQIVTKQLHNIKIGK